MCGCSKNKGQQNARGRTPPTPIRTNRNFVSSPPNTAMTADQRKKQALRRDMLRRARGV